MSGTATFVCVEMGGKPELTLSKRQTYERRVKAGKGGSAEEELDRQTRSLDSAGVGLLSETGQALVPRAQALSAAPLAPVPALQTRGPRPVAARRDGSRDPSLSPSSLRAPLFAHLCRPSSASARLTCDGCAA
jgi:hypothetical protein